MVVGSTSLKGKGKQQGVIKSNIKPRTTGKPGKSGPATPSAQGGDLCWDLKNKGHCPRGPRCQWNHDLSGQSSSNATGSARAPSRPAAAPKNDSQEDLASRIKALQAELKSMQGGTLTADQVEDQDDLAGDNEEDINMDLNLNLDLEENQDEDGLETGDSLSNPFGNDEIPLLIPDGIEMAPSPDKKESANTTVTPAAGTGGKGGKPKGQKGQQVGAMSSTATGKYGSFNAKGAGKSTDNFKGGKGLGKKGKKFRTYEPWTRPGPNGEAPTDMTCWDFKNGNCRRGDRCKWQH